MCCIVPVTAVQGPANFNWRGIAGFQPTRSAGVQPRSACRHCLTCSMTSMSRPRWATDACSSAAHSAPQLASTGRVIGEREEERLLLLLLSSLLLLLPRLPLPSWACSCLKKLAPVNKRQSCKSVCGCAEGVDHVWEGCDRQTKGQEEAQHTGNMES